MVDFTPIMDWAATFYQALTLRTAYKERDFLLNIANLPDYIGRRELEIYLIILKAKKRFSSLADIYTFLLTEHLSKEKERRPQYNKQKDKKYYLAKNDGVLSNLFRAGLLQRLPDPDLRRKTWKNKIVPTWKNSVVSKAKINKYEAKGAFLPMTEFDFTEEELITGLEGYIYHGKPGFILKKKEIEELSKMTTELLWEDIKSTISLLTVRQYTMQAIKEMKEEENNETAPER